MVQWTPVRAMAVFGMTQSFDQRSIIMRKVKSVNSIKLMRQIAHRRSSSIALSDWSDGRIEISPSAAGVSGDVQGERSSSEGPLFDR